MLPRNALDFQSTISILPSLKHCYQYLGTLLFYIKLPIARFEPLTAIYVMKIKNDKISPRLKVITMCPQKTSLILNCIHNLPASQDFKACFKKLILSTLEPEICDNTMGH